MGLQTSLCHNIQAYEPHAVFRQDAWQRESGGGGITCCLRSGEVFESAGVNFSHVFGDKLPPAATILRPELSGRHFQALGLSVVLHPRNPYVPTSHFNVRFFMAEKAGAPPVWWFGGGFDLTPYYGFEEDVIHWHQQARHACVPFGEAVYPRYKVWADKYFYLPHRNEPRGVGGLFYDDLNTDTWGWDSEKCFEFMRAIGTHYWLAYEPIIKKRYTQAYGAREKAFQHYRRGRYVEFNLIYDRGTLFGLQSGGRTESILMSLPPQVSWEYNWQPEAGSPEAALTEEFLVSKHWISF